METRSQSREWEGKLEGKMFQRLECASCGNVYHFGEQSRASRTPRCPVCGSFERRSA